MCLQLKQPKEITVTFISMSLSSEELNALQNFSENFSIFRFPLCTGQNFCQHPQFSLVAFFIKTALFTCARLVFVECFDCLPPRLGVAPCIAREHAQMYPHKATPHHATSWNKSSTFLLQSFALEIVEQRHDLLAPHVVWRLCVAYLPHPSSGNTWLKVKHVDFICTPSAICMVFSSIQMNSWPISTILGGPYTLCGFHNFLKCVWEAMVTTSCIPLLTCWQYCI